MKPLFSREFLEQYKEGKRTFENVILQFMDFKNLSLKDITFIDSKLSFVTFYECDIENARFINCEIFYGSFNGGWLKNTVFDRCKMDYSIFHNGNFKNTKIIKSGLVWCAIFNKSIQNLDYSSSACSKVFTNVSQVTEKDIEEVLQQLKPIINSLDMSIKSRIERELHESAEKYGKEIKNMPIGTSQEYGSSAHDIQPSTYGTRMQSMLESMKSAYKAQQPYKTKRTYETESKYK